MLQQQLELACASVSLYDCESQSLSESRPLLGRLAALLTRTYRVLIYRQGLYINRDFIYEQGLAGTGWDPGTGLDCWDCLGPAGTARDPAAGRGTLWDRA